MFRYHFRPTGYFGLFLLVCVIFAPVAVVAPNSVNDTFVSQQWGWFRIKADKAYDEGCCGEGIVVALLDTGADLGHPDLASNIVDGWNFVDKNDNVNDVDGHGTMVSGIIAAVANNSLGIVGVASKVSIMPLKVLSETDGSWIDLNLAIRYAADNGARVIGMSLGGYYSRLGQATENAIDYAYQKGCILVAAVGNDNSSELFYPAAYEQVVAVSAIDQDDKKASFSNFGDYVDFCAPGVNILTTAMGGEYAFVDGTSFAAPFVSGVIALMLSKYPYLSGNEIVESLRVHAVDLGEEGADQYYGWGLIDARAAVTETPIPESSGAVSMVLIVSVTTIIFALKKARGLRRKIAI